MTPRWARLALGVVAYFACAGNALAHFPISRAVAVGPRGAVAVALPGFGLALRTAAGEPFAYACDALLGVAPSDSPPALSFTADGSLLIGSGSGLRALNASGCPRADLGVELQKQPLARIAVHPARPSIVYAVTAADLPRVWRSEDGGATWEKRSSLVALSPVTALALDPSDPDVVHVSQATPGGGGLLHVSTDGGTTFSAITQEAERTLLDVEPAGDAGTSRFWAVGRSATATVNQGFSLFGSMSASGPWSPVFDVRFFGGFARQTDGTLWFGDEAGGVYRSTDRGSSFTDVSPATAVSCLDFAEGMLFGCTPGLAEQNTLVTWSDARQSFDGVIALSNVTRLVECTPDADVAKQCAAAWVEWRRDILMLPQSLPDAGTPPTGTGGSPAVPPRPDAGIHLPSPEAGNVPVTPDAPPDASTSPVSSRADSSGGCSIAKLDGGMSPASSRCAFALGALCVAAAGARRRLRRAR